MSSIIQHKRVEFSELFYDLVFVYAISQSTGIIHHLHNGILPLFNFITFILSLMVLVNTWLIQTVFTNRYGKNSFLNVLFMFTDMGLMLFLSNTFSVNWKEVFYDFTTAIALLSLSLFLQYFIQYMRSKNYEDKEMTKSFLYILSLRTIGIFICSRLPYDIGIYLYFIIITITLIMPIFFQRQMRLVPINFPHLVERISLMVIIMFGEMIVEIAHFFTPQSFNIISIFYLIIAISLFFIYFGEFDHSIDETENTLGIRLIYSHYLIFSGILMTTVSMEFLTDPNCNHIFVSLFIYSGILLFLIAVLANGKYNKEAYQWTKSYLITEGIIFAIGFLLSIIFAYSANAVIIITAITLSLISINFIFFYIQKNKEYNDPHKIHIF